MSIDRTIVLLKTDQVGMAKAVMDANWAAMERDGRPMAVRLYEHRESRSLEQQALMWIRLDEVAKQAWVDGKQFADTTWHEAMKREYLPEEPGPSKSARKGYRKWDYLPNGERVLVGSTTQLTVFGMSEYMEQLMAYGAGTLGVHFSATPAEMAAA